MENVLHQHFFYNFEGQVWKLRPDMEKQYLAVEVRQKEKLQAAFFTIDTVTGKLLLEGYNTPEQWWTGMEDAYGGKMFLHGYSTNRETGKHLGLTTISAESGETDWQKKELTFIGLNSSETLLAENALGQIREIALETGEENAYLQSREHAKNQINAFEKIRNQQLQFPVPYLPTDDHFELLQRFIFQKTGRQAEQAIEYLENADYIVVSFYAKNPIVLANYLVVCSAAGNLLLDICLESNVIGLGSDTFFIFASKLFFIQEKSALACYLL